MLMHSRRRIRNLTLEDMTVIAFDHGFELPTQKPFSNVGAACGTGYQHFQAAVQVLVQFHESIGPERVVSQLGMLGALCAQRREIKIHTIAIFRIADHHFQRAAGHFVEHNTHPMVDDAHHQRVAVAFLCCRVCTRSRRRCR